MKKIRINKLTIGLIVTMLMMASCGKEDVEILSQGKIEFGLNIDNIENGRTSEALTDNIKYAVISLMNDNDELVYELKKIELLNFNGQFISSPLAVPVGDYQLTDFLILDEENNVVYLTPKSDSPKSYLVERPLPIDLSIIKDAVEKVVPEVISSENSAPADFGYTTFGFDIVSTFDIQLGVFVYNGGSGNFDLSAAELTIDVSQETIFSNELEPITNTIAIKDIPNSSYNIQVSKDGYKSFSYVFSYDSLSYYKIENENDPLVIVLEEKHVPVGSFYGLGWQNGNLVFGSVDYEGNEQIIKELPYGSIYGAYSTFDNDNQYYIFGTEQGTIVIDILGNEISTIPENTLNPAYLEYSSSNKILYGLGWQNGNLVFGSVDYQGNEQIIKELPYGSIYGAYSTFDNDNQYYIFGTEQGTIVIDILGNVITTILKNTLNPAYLEYSSSDKILYGLGWQNGNLVFGSVDYQGNEQIIKELPNSSIYGSYSTFDNDNQYYIFGTEQGTIAIDVLGNVILTIPKNTLNPASLEVS